jgi:hypothetical protein
MIMLPDQASADYLRAIGAAAVYVLADPWGLSRVGASQHLQRTFDAWEQQHFEPKWIGWVRNLELAEWLAAAPLRFKQRDGNIRVLTWERLVVLIQDVAAVPDPLASAYAPLYPISEHETAITNAAQMAQKVRINLDVLKQNGALRSFNAAYKKYNEGRRARRERGINFSDFETELKNSLACILASGAEPLSGTVLADMRRKFPFLNNG